MDGVHTSLNRCRDMDKPSICQCASSLVHLLLTPAATLLVWLEARALQKILSHLFLGTDIRFELQAAGTHSRPLCRRKGAVTFPSRTLHYISVVGMTHPHGFLFFHGITNCTASLTTQLGRSGIFLTQRLDGHWDALLDWNLPKCMAV